MKKKDATTTSRNLKAYLEETIKETQSQINCLAGEINAQSDRLQVLRDKRGELQYILAEFCGSKEK